MKESYFFYDKDTMRPLYNMEKDDLKMPEYGRIIQNMVSMVKEIPDREKRSAQAKVVVKAMGILNPQVRAQENWEQVLWDHLFIIADYDLDIDSPYPMPHPDDRQTKPMPLKVEKTPVRATHYGRNIESIIDLIAEQPDGEVKTATIRSLAIYMRQQYLIWNKDSVADETIFADIEKLSGGRITVPAGLQLTPISFENANFSRPGIGNGMSQGMPRKKKNKKNRK